MMLRREDVEVAAVGALGHLPSALALVTPGWGSELSALGANRTRDDRNDVNDP